MLNAVGADADEVIESVGYSDIPPRPPVDLEIVMPVHNVEQRLPEALTALTTCLEHQLFSAAIVVVDTGSSDRTIDIAAAWPVSRVPIALLGCSDRARGAPALEGLVTSQARFAALCDVRSAALIEHLDSAMPLLWEGIDIVSCSSPDPRSAMSRCSSRLHLRAAFENCLTFFAVAAAVPLLSACVANGESLGTGVIALAREVGLKAVDL